MAVRVDVDEGAARWPEIVAEVEAGREVVIARGAVPVAEIARPATPPRRSVADEIREGRKDLAPVALDGLAAWRDEDRR